MLAAAERVRTGMRLDEAACPRLRHIVARELTYEEMDAAFRRAYVAVIKESSPGWEKSEEQ